METQSRPCGGHQAHNPLAVRHSRAQVARYGRCVILASMFRKRTAPTIEPGASELQSFASSAIVRRHRLCPSQLHSRQHGRVIAARRRDGGQQFVIPLPGVGSQRLAGEHHTGEPDAVGMNSARIAAEEVSTFALHAMPEMHRPDRIARGKSAAAANFGLECSGVGSEGSQGSAVIRVSREEQEAVTHILRLLSRSMAGREQDAGWAATR